MAAIETIWRVSLSLEMFLIYVPPRHRDPRGDQKRISSDRDQRVRKNLRYHGWQPIT